jgi:hypothetical protein
MELFTIVTAVFGSLVAFGLLAVTNGADSRDAMTDDWARTANV